MAVMTMIDDGEEKEKKQKTDRQVNQLCPYKEAGEQRQWRHNQGKILAHSQPVQHTQAASFCTTDFANRRH